MLIQKLFLSFINKVTPLNKYHISFLLQHGKYQALLTLLSNHSFFDKGSSSQKKKRVVDLEHLILTIYAYLGLKDFGSSKSILKEIESNYPQYISAELNFIYAYLFLIENKKVLAIEKYVTLIHHKKYGRQAKNILKLLKEEEDTQSILLQYTKLDYFLIPIKKYTHWWSRLYRQFLFLLILGLAFLYAFTKLADSSNLRDRIKLSQEGISDNLIVFEKKDNNSTKLKNYYSLEQELNEKENKKWLTEVEARTKFNQMKQYLYDKKINLAIIKYNESMQYNLTLALREEFNFLYKSVPKVDYHHFENTYPFQNLFSTNSVFYINTYLKYKGIVSNIKQDKKITTFFFTIVKQKGNDIEDIVEVYIDSDDLKLKAGQYYNLLGRVKGYARNKKKMIVEGLILEPSGY